ncbi:MAG: hypothetical protein ACD_21C00266G0006 [uncultured bacterium]|nr:MAG: hypothetical protein ACD_21C00266G0006 [uncultured bacterium]
MSKLLAKCIAMSVCLLLNCFPASFASITTMDDVKPVNLHTTRGIVKIPDTLPSGDYLVKVCRGDGNTVAEGEALVSVGQIIYPGYPLPVSEEFDGTITSTIKCGSYLIRLVQEKGSAIMISKITGGCWDATLTPIKTDGEEQEAFNAWLADQTMDPTV